MSKSMWCDAVNSKPVHYNTEYSVRVAVWIKGEEGPRWGSYDYMNQWWSVDQRGTVYNEQIEYFAYVENPYT